MSGDRTLNPTIAWGPGLATWVRPPAAAVSSPATTSSRRRRSITATVTSNGSPPATLAEQPAHEGQFRFAGVDDHYFMAAAVDPGQARSSSAR